MKKILWVLLIVCFFMIGCSKNKEKEPLTELNENEEIDEQIEQTSLPEVVESKEEPVTESIRIIADVLNIRADKTIASDIVAKAKNKEIYKVLEIAVDQEGKTWYKIKKEDVVGWVAGWYCVDVNNYNDKLELAYQGLMEKIEIGIHFKGSDVISKWGKPKAEGNFIGGLYMTYEDVTFLTDGIMQDGRVSDYGEVKMISYQGDKAMFGVKIGMTLQEAIGIIGEPDKINEYDPQVGESELYGLNWLAVYNTGEYDFILQYEKENAPINNIYLEVHK